MGIKHKVNVMRCDNCGISMKHDFDWTVSDWRIKEIANEEYEWKNINGNWYCPQCISTVEKEKGFEVRDIVKLIGDIYPVSVGKIIKIQKRNNEFSYQIRFQNILENYIVTGTDWFNDEHLELLYREEK